MLAAEPASVAPDAIVDAYWSASRDQDRLLKGASMEVEIQAALPRLKKHGRLHALRRISSLGRITYERLLFEGDGTVKNNVISRYLTAEAQSQTDESPSLAVTPENYKFKYRGLKPADDQMVYVFEVSPRQKKVGLFKGELWIDPATYLRVRESGRFVKTPSIFLKKIEFVRTYEIRDGVSVPRKIQSVVDTRLIGRAELTVEFTNVALNDNSPTRRASLLDVDGH